MAFWSKLFSSSPSSSPKELDTPDKTLEYKGFLISAAPYKNNGQWQLAGTVSKDGKTHKFVRADVFTDTSDASNFALVKGQVIVDQLGEDMFR
jgi:hypothetical protein